MKKILYILTLICGVSIYSAYGYDYNRIERAPAIESPNKAVLYKYYLRKYGYPNGGNLIFNDDYTFSYCDRLAGEWRVKGDTLFLYENYEYHPIDLNNDEQIKIFGITDSVGLDSLISLDPIFAPRYRDVMAIDPLSDYRYAANVTTYIIHNYGDSLVSVCPEYSGIQEPLSSCHYDEFIYITEDYYKNRPKDVGGGVNYSFGSKQALEEYRKLVNYRPWHNVAMQWEKGDFLVKDKSVVEGKIIMVDLERDSITYHVVNPMFYLKDNPTRLYDKKAEKVLTEWMSNVEIGKSYNFRLQRPDYPKDSLAKIPRLNTGSDSLCISESEAYGYFFARRVRK